MSSTAREPVGLFDGADVQSLPLSDIDGRRAAEVLDAAKAFGERFTTAIELTEQVLDAGWRPSGLAWACSGDHTTPLLFNEPALTTDPVTFRVAVPELVHSAGADLVVVRTLTERSSTLGVVSIDAVDARRHLLARTFVALAGPRVRRLTGWHAAVLDTDQAELLGRSSFETRRAMAQVATGSPRRRSRPVVAGPFWRTVGS